LGRREGVWQPSFSLSNFLCRLLLATKLQLNLYRIFPFSLGGGFVEKVRGCGGLHIYPGSG